VTSTFPLRSWVPEIHRNLNETILLKPGLACFDFDNTLIRNDFGEKLMEAIIQDGMVHLPKDLSPYFRDKDFWKDHEIHPLSQKESLIWEEYSYHLKEFGIENGYRWTCFLFQGLSKQTFYELSRRNWEKVGKLKGDIAVFPQKEMIDLIQFLNQNSWEVYIVTASPEEGIAAIASHFYVKEENVIGMRQVKSSTGISVPEIIEPYTYGEGKVSAIRTRIGKLPDLAFGDSFNDFPMLCASKLGVAIDKGNPEFVEACQKKQILIQPYFSLSS